MANHVHRAPGLRVANCVHLALSRSIILANGAVVELESALLHIETHLIRRLALRVDRVNITFTAIGVDCVDQLLLLDRERPVLLTWIFIAHGIGEIRDGFLGLLIKKMGGRDVLADARLVGRLFHPLARSVHREVFLQVEASVLVHERLVRVQVAVSLHFLDCLGLVSLWNAKPRLFVDNIFLLFRAGVIHCLGQIALQIRVQLVNAAVVFLFRQVLDLQFYLSLVLRLESGGAVEDVRVILVHIQRRVARLLLVQFQVVDVVSEDGSLEFYLRSCRARAVHLVQLNLLLLTLFCFYGVRDFFLTLVSSLLVRVRALLLSCQVRRFWHVLSANRTLPRELLAVLPAKRFIGDHLQVLLARGHAEDELALAMFAAQLRILVVELEFLIGGELLRRDVFLPGFGRGLLHG